MYHKDLLNLVFLELENGHTMINFSEINRKCNQIFQQQIKIMTTYSNEKIMTNVHNHKHGIYRRFYYNGQLLYDFNFLQGCKHGLWREWYEDGQLGLEKNYSHGQLHGICRWWHVNGQFWYEDNYIHGKKIEK